MYKNYVRLRTKRKIDVLKFRFQNETFKQYNCAFVKKYQKENSKVDNGKSIIFQEPQVQNQTRNRELPSKHQNGKPAVVTFDFFLVKH